MPALIIIFIWVAIALLNFLAKQKQQEAKRQQGGQGPGRDKPVYQAPRGDLEEFLRTVKGEARQVRTPGKPAGTPIQVRQPGMRVQPKKPEPDYVTAVEKLEPYAEYKAKPVEEIAELPPIAKTPVPPPPPQSMSAPVPLPTQRGRARPVLRPEGAKPQRAPLPPLEPVSMPEVPEAAPAMRAAGLDDKGLAGAIVMAEILSQPVALRRMGARRRHIGI